MARDMARGWLFASSGCWTRHKYKIIFVSWSSIFELNNFDETSMSAFYVIISFILTQMGELWLQLLIFNIRFLSIYQLLPHCMTFTYHHYCVSYEHVYTIRSLSTECASYIGKQHIQHHKEERLTYALHRLSSISFVDNTSLISSKYITLKNDIQIKSLNATLPYLLKKAWLELETFST